MMGGNIRLGTLLHPSSKPSPSYYFYFCSTSPNNFDIDDPVYREIEAERERKEGRVPKHIREQILAGNRPGPKTGAKGVRADYKAFKWAEYQQIQYEKVRRGKRGGGGVQGWMYMDR